jgi:hypothetical protein
VGARVVTTLACSALLATACGAGTTSNAEAWQAAHPDPPGVHFVKAEGLCAVTVRYPTEAPGEIDYGAGAYIQRDRSTAPSDPGKQVGRSADWTLYQQDTHTLLLVTPSTAYTYKDGAKCGSNSAAPT